MKTIDLSGGLVIVTGGAGSIGSAIAVDAADAGAAVAVCDSNHVAAEAIAAGIRSRGGSAAAFSMDVRNQYNVLEVTKQAVQQLGSLQGIVTAAGLLRTGSLARQNASDWEDVMAVNVTGTLHAVQAANHTSLQLAGPLSPLAVCRHLLVPVMEALTPRQRVLS